MKEHYQKILKNLGVCQLVLILSHRDAGVESETSVNWDTLVENLKKRLILLYVKFMIQSYAKEVFWILK